jgi:coenzyme Q-binding protein COQ10
MRATTLRGSVRRAPPSSRPDRLLSTRHAERRVVAHTPHQLFVLVADVVRYPEFLPWCHAARIRRRESATIEIAELAIGFGPFHEKFVSRVVLDPDDPGGPRIDTTGIEGPFRLLRSRWVFRPHAEGTLIDFELEFDFRSLLLQKTVQLLFGEAVKRMVSAFETRAMQLYGRPSARPGPQESSTR